MKKPIIIYGAGGLGREILSLINGTSEWEVKGFVDDATNLSEIKGVKLLGNIDYVNSIKVNVDLILAIGSPRMKAGIVKRITNRHVRFPVVRHPSAIIQDVSSVELGEGCVICAGVILTNDINIGNHVLLNINSTVGHDTTIGNYCSVMPGVNVAGAVTIEESVLIGSGANIINHVKIMRESIIGMGAVVLRDVSANSTVAGVPAKVIKP